MDLSDKEVLIKLANTPMPYGRYKGRVIIDLPGPYLVWFAREGFPEGEIGQLLALAHEIDLNGLKGLITPLKNINSVNK